jgi:hypothetical protein
MCGSSNQEFFCSHQDEAEIARPYRILQSPIAAGSQKKQPDESISLLTSAVIERLDQQKWTPSDVLIFKGDRDIRLRIHQKGSLQLEIIGESEKYPMRA